MIVCLRHVKFQCLYLVADASSRLAIGGDAAHHARCFIADSSRPRPYASEVVISAGEQRSLQLFPVHGARASQLAERRRMCSESRRCLAIALWCQIISRCASFVLESAGGRRSQDQIVPCISRGRSEYPSIRPHLSDGVRGSGATSVAWRARAVGAPALLLGRGFEEPSQRTICPLTRYCMTESRKAGALCKMQPMLLLLESSHFPASAKTASQVTRTCQRITHCTDQMDLLVATRGLSIQGQSRAFAVVGLVLER